MDLSDTTWGKYKLTDLFDIFGTIKKDPEDFNGPGPYPLISAKTTDNGVLGLYDTYTEKGGVLTVETACNGFCSYQKQNFSGHGHLAVLRPKFNMSDRIALFLVTVINADRKNYSYGRKCTIQRLKQRYICLPATNTFCSEITSDMGLAPDWKFMDQYMKDLLVDSSGGLGVKLYFEWED